MMRIAVIIPVYNVTAFLEKAVASVVAQNYPELEIIVVDDGSAPELAMDIDRICARYPQVILLRQSHRGAAAARDAGMARANAESLLFLDADDVLLSGALEHFANTLNNNPDAVAVYGMFVEIDESGAVISKVLPVKSRIASGKLVLEYLLERKTPFCYSSMIIRKKSLAALHVQNHHLTIGEDSLLWCHLALLGDIIFAGDHVVVQRRKHQQNISNLGIKNPDLIFAAYDATFKDPVFMTALGAEKLGMLQEKCMSRTYAYLASAYASQSRTEEAMVYLQKMTLSFSEIADSMTEYD